jgi:hypothetical protein
VFNSEVELDGVFREVRGVVLEVAINAKKSLCSDI